MCPCAFRTWPSHTPTEQCLWVLAVYSSRAWGMAMWWHILSCTAKKHHLDNSHGSKTCILAENSRDSFDGVWGLFFSRFCCYTLQIERFEIPISRYFLGYRHVDSWVSAPTTGIAQIKNYAMCKPKAHDSLGYPAWRKLLEFRVEPFILACRQGPRSGCSSPTLWPLGA